jgi:hypothetical protein
MSRLEEIEKALGNMSVPELSRFIDNLKTLTLIVCKRELRKAFARRIEKFSERLEVVEKRKGIRKSITGQDNDNDGIKWPSLSS